MFFIIMGYSSIFMVLHLSTINLYHTYKWYNIDTGELYQYIVVLSLIIHYTNTNDFRFLFVFYFMLYDITNIFISNIIIS